MLCTYTRYAVPQVCTRYRYVVTIPQVCTRYRYVVTVVTLNCYCFCNDCCCWCTLLLMLCIGALLYMTAAAAAPAAQYCCSTTKRMPKYYYCVREEHTLIYLASLPFGLRTFYAHARTMVGFSTVLSVFLTP